MLHTMRHRATSLLSRARQMYVCGVQQTVSCSSLPRIPVPALDHSMGRYLDYVRPYLSDDQFIKTTEAVQRFLKFPGPELQFLLERHAEEVTNWVTCQVQDDMLRCREPLPINWNFCCLYPPEASNGLDGQLRLAARTTTHFLHAKEKIENGTFADPHVRKGQHDMGTVRQAFASCRLPRRHKDVSVSYPTKDAVIRHINVIHNNQIFSLDVYGENGKRLNTDQIHAQLKRVVEESDSTDLPVGLLTTLDRDTWADVQADLMLDERNKETLDNIHRSLFVLCLDKSMDSISNEASWKTMNTGTTHLYTEGRTLPVIQLFHGGGVDLNTANRWFDKGLQIIVGTDGTYGLNSEHANLDGGELQTLTYNILKPPQDTSLNTDMEGIPQSQLVPPRKLLLHMNDKTKSAVHNARRSITQLINDTDVKSSNFIKFGKKAMRGVGLKPNSFMHVALQLTYYRLHQNPPQSEEHVGMSMYKFGRTDSLKTYTSHIHAFIQSMDDVSVDDAEKVTLLKQATGSHHLLMTEGTQGRGFRAHLLGLEETAAQYGYAVPDVFLDPAFALCSPGTLDGTQVVGPDDVFACMSPSPGGYAFWYNIQDKIIKVAAVGVHGKDRIDSAQFLHALSHSLQDMYALMAPSS